eukprot:superscaffoldBa00003891_g17903
MQELTCSGFSPTPSPLHPQWPPFDPLLPPIHPLTLPLPRASPQLLALCAFLPLPPPPPLLPPAFVCKRPAKGERRGGLQRRSVKSQPQAATSQGLLKYLGEGGVGGYWTLDLPSLLSAPCPSQTGAFPGQRGTVCGLAPSQSSQPACLCQPPSPETKDKAGTRPDTPRSLFISPSFPSSSL